MLQLPDVRQAENYDCGPASIDTVLRFFGVRSKTSVVQCANEIDGTHPATLETALRRAGLLVCAGRMSLADLTHHTRLGRPVLCPVDLFGGHWVVVRGATSKRVYFHCPSEGPQWVTRDRWLSIWHDSERSGDVFVNWGLSVWAS